MAEFVKLLSCSPSGLIHIFQGAQNLSFKRVRARARVRVRVRVRVLFSYRAVAHSCKVCVYVCIFMVCKHSMYIQVFCDMD